MIRHDGTTYEATNETVAKHGGIKHIGFNYAIDNQGKMWVLHRQDTGCSGRHIGQYDRHYTGYA